MDTSWPWRVAEAGAAELWDLTRPLIGDCHMELLKFDDPEAKAVSQQLTHRQLLLTGTHYSIHDTVLMEEM